MVEAVELAEIYRGDNIESIHNGIVVVLGPNGVEQRLGDINFASYTRSIIKAIQVKVANNLLNNELEGKDLAIAMSSHGAEPEQISALTALMKKYQISETDLHCGIYNNGRVQLKSKIEHNCSGKHSALIAACKKQNWNIENYYDINHPIQIAIYNELLRLKQDSNPLPIAIDGCGIPTFYMSIITMAKIFYAMINDPSYQIIIQTMRQYPELIGGQRQIDTLLMQNSSNLIAKGGAEGLMMIANLDTKQVAIVKILDGSSRAKAIINRTIAQELGWIKEIDLEDKIYNSRNEAVGHIACLVKFR